MKPEHAARLGLLAALVVGVWLFLAFLPHDGGRYAGRHAGDTPLPKPCPVVSTPRFSQTVRIGRDVLIEQVVE